MNNAFIKNKPSSNTKNSFKNQFPKTEKKDNSSGIKLLTGFDPICGLYSHELKSMATNSRVCGFIRPTNVGFVIIFCYFDHGGKITGH